MTAVSEIVPISTKIIALRNLNLLADWIGAVPVAAIARRTEVGCVEADLTSGVSVVADIYISVLFSIIIANIPTFRDTPQLSACAVLSSPAGSVDDRKSIPASTKLRSDQEPQSHRNAQIAARCPAERRTEWQRACQPACQLRAGCAALFCIENGDPEQLTA
jgi:hypothetical protein